MTNRVQHLTIPDQALRERALNGLDAGDDYGRWRTAFPVLDEIQMGQGETQSTLIDHCRVGAWNLERGAHWQAAAELILDQGLDILLASEMDLGMSRTNQCHTTQALAEALGWHWAYAVEFIELGTGSPWEQNQPDPGTTNRCGLHGNAILSRYPLEHIRMIRFPASDGAWWHRRWDEPRLGGRMALIAQISSAYGPIQLVSTHLESNAHPNQRANQISDLLTALEPSMPIILGGDLNTSTLDTTSLSDVFRRRQDLARNDPTRFIQPEAHEPLFAILANAGYRKGTANTHEPTQRPRERGYPKPPLGRIDWFFIRGCLAERPRTQPAVNTAGETLSDHDLIITDIVLR
ncbi:MAG: hypothetical protein EBS77_00130 [Gammaproteobacteria bacterium]|nr:hypothetical protein [Gammaproteobacteria bacterium]